MNHSFCIFGWLSTYCTIKHEIYLIYLQVSELDFTFTFSRFMKANETFSRWLPDP